jgi:hypothetical protein
MSRKNIINEPLKHFFKKYGAGISNSEKIVYGHKYSVVLLKNGNIGVCDKRLNDVKVEVRND